MSFENKLKTISPPISSIKTGTPLIKIGSNYVVGGIGGNYIPSGGGGGGSSNFYKCASVDTVNKKWTGYKANIDSETGAWSFAETATEDLTYTFPVPVEGTVYAGENCLCKASDFYTGFPTDGLVFYLPFTEATDTDATGKTLDILNSPNITYTTVQGIRCAKIGYRSHIFGPDFNEILPNSRDTRFTLSFWAYNEGGGSDLRAGFMRGQNGGVTYMSIYNNQTLFQVDSSGSFTTETTNNIFANYIATFEGSYFNIYKNGTLLGQVNLKSGNYGPFGFIQEEYWRYPYCPGTYGPWYSDYNCYIAAFRAYNRVLTSVEIMTLAGEFTPIVE